jgi:hypothetical protein
MVTVHQIVAIVVSYHMHIGITRAGYRSIPQHLLNSKPMLSKNHLAIVYYTYRNSLPIYAR